MDNSAVGDRQDSDMHSNDESCNDPSPAPARFLYESLDPAPCGLLTRFRRDQPENGDRGLRNRGVVTSTGRYPNRELSGADR